MADPTDTTPAPRDRKLGTTARRLTPHEIVQALAMRADGKTVTEIAKALQCSTETAYRIVTQYESSTDLASKFLNGQALGAAKHWFRAIKNGAARGRHEPARDLLLHTGAIQPVATDSAGPRVAVFIGVPEGQRQSPGLLVDTQPVVVGTLEQDVPQPSSLPVVVEQERSHKV